MRVPPVLIRAVLTPLQLVRRLLWLVTGYKGDGVHAVALTPGGSVVLVRLTYASGWRLPGGGRKRGEAQLDAMLRELREEIGLVGHGGIERIDDRLKPPRPGEVSAMFLVRGVVYAPRRSLEIEEVREFDPARLPDDLGGATRETLAALGYG